MKIINPQIWEDWWTPSIGNMKKTTPRHIMIKFLKTSDKDKNGQRKDVLHSKDKDKDGSMSIVNQR